MYPGAFCQILGLGTMVVDPGGKFTIIGSECQEDTDQMMQLMSGIINTLSPSGNFILIGAIREDTDQMKKLMSTIINTRSIMNRMVAMSISNTD